MFVAPRRSATALDKSRDSDLYQLQFKPARYRMFTLRENMLFFEKLMRSFELETVLHHVQ
jgi:hypothetical protein